MVEVLADLVAARLERKLEALARGDRPAGAAPPRLSSGDEWLTAEAAARYLGMNKKAFYSAVERRQIPVSRLGRRLRFSRAGLDHLLMRRQGRDVESRPRVPSPRKD